VQDRSETFTNAEKNKSGTHPLVRKAEPSVRHSEEPNEILKVTGTNEKFESRKNPKAVHVDELVKRGEVGAKSVQTPGIDETKVLSEDSRAEVSAKSV